MPRFRMYPEPAPVELPVPRLEVAVPAPAAEAPLEPECEHDWDVAGRDRGIVLLQCRKCPAFGQRVESLSVGRSFAASTRGF